VLLVDDLPGDRRPRWRRAPSWVGELQGEIVGMTVLIELTGLKGRDRVRRFGHVHSVLTC